MVIKLDLIRDLEKSLQVTHYIPQSPTLTIGGTVLQQSDDLDISGVAFDSKMTLRSILARFPEQFSKTWYLEEILASIP